MLAQLDKKHKVIDSMQMMAQEPSKNVAVDDRTMLAQLDKKHKVVDSMQMKADEPLKSQSLNN